MKNNTEVQTATREQWADFCKAVARHGEQLLDTVNHLFIGVRLRGIDPARLFPLPITSLTEIAERIGVDPASLIGKSLSDLQQRMDIQMQRWLDQHPEFLTAYPLITSPPTAPSTTGRTEERAPSPSPDPRTTKEPSKDAIAAYRAYRAGLMNQEQIARELDTNQGQISRWVEQVGKWMESRNVLPAIPAPASRARAVDPAMLEMGKRQTHLTSRQRQRSNTED